MRPTLAPGTEVVATDSRDAAVGEIVVFEHPNRAGFWLIKRRVEPPLEVPSGHAWVSSDNAIASSVDSSVFGPVPTDSLLPVVVRLDDAMFREACALLTVEDEALGALASAYGTPTFWSRPQGFPTLVLLILEQQVSLESGAAAYRKLLEATGQMTPGAVLELGESGQRDLGITRQKAGYLIGLAESVEEGALDLDRIDSGAPDEARASLLEVRGVGPWTAEAYMLSALRHPDVFPVGDRALQVATAEALGLSSVPAPGELILLAEPWRPVRAAAARLLWHAYLESRGRSDPSAGLLDRV